MDHVIAYSGDPVVVIGNGPVGETASLLLARWGIPVIVLDGRPERRPAWLEGHLPAAGCPRCLGGGRSWPPAGRRRGDVVDGSDLL